MYCSLIDISLFPNLNLLFNGPSDGVAPSVAAFNITLCPQYCPSVACVSSKLLLAEKFPHSTLLTHHKRRLFEVLVLHDQ